MKKPMKTLEIQLIMRFNWGNYEVELCRRTSGGYSLTFCDTTRNLVGDMIFFKDLEELEVKYNTFAPGAFLRLYVGIEPDNFKDFKEGVETYMGSEELGPIEHWKIIEVS